MKPVKQQDQSNLKWVADFIWNIADDRLRDVYVRGKYRDVILPFIVLISVPHRHAAARRFFVAFRCLGRVLPSKRRSKPIARKPAPIHDFVP